MKLLQLIEALDMLNAEHVQVTIRTYENHVELFDGKMEHTPYYALTAPVLYGDISLKAPIDGRHDITVEVTIR